MNAPSPALSFMRPDAIASLQRAAIPPRIFKPSETSDAMVETLALMQAGSKRYLRKSMRARAKQFLADPMKIACAFPDLLEWSTSAAIAHAFVQIRKSGGRIFSGEVVGVNARGLLLAARVARRMERRAST